MKVPVDHQDGLIGLANGYEHADPRRIMKREPVLKILKFYSPSPFPRQFIASERPKDRIEREIAGHVTLSYAIAWWIGSAPSTPTSF